MLIGMVPDGTLRSVHGVLVRFASRSLESSKPMTVKLARKLQNQNFNNSFVLVIMAVHSTKRSIEELNDNDEFVTLYCDILADRDISAEKKQERWDSLSEVRKTTPAVALAAVKAGILSPFKLPESLLSSKRFMLQVATVCSDTWDNLVPKFKSDPEFAYAIIQCADLSHGRIVKAMLVACPSLCVEAKFWIQFAKSALEGDPCVIQEETYHIYDEFFQKALLSNQDVVLALFSCGLIQVRELDEIDKVLFRDATFVSRFLDAAAERKLLLDALQHPLWKNIYVSMRDVIITGLAKNLGSQQLTRTTVSSMSDFIECLDDDILNDIRFKNAWFAAKGPWFVDRVPVSWLADKTVLLLVAKHQALKHKSDDLSCFDAALRADKKLMCQACSFDPTFYRVCNPSIKDDNDIHMCILRGVYSLRRFSSSTRVALGVLGDRRNAERLRSRWTQQKHARIAMDTLILPAMYISSKHGTERNALCILNQGDHHVKHLVAEYLDYPFGNPLTVPEMEMAITGAQYLQYSELVLADS